MSYAEGACEFQNNCNLYSVMRGVFSLSFPEKG